MCKEQDAFCVLWQKKKPKLLFLTMMEKMMLKKSWSWMEISVVTDAAGLIEQWSLSDNDGCEVGKSLYHISKKLDQH